MIQINKLYSLEIVKDIYYINDKFEIINSHTNNVKIVSVGKRGYPYVTLETTENRNIKVPLHKIIALAFIENKPYELIEHIDDNKLNYSIDNLKFSNHKNNAMTASRNGLLKRKENIFDVILHNGQSYCGTLKNISKLSGIPKGSLYDHYYHPNTNGKK